MTGWNLPPGCEVRDLPGFRDCDDEPEGFECVACDDVGWITDGAGNAVPCPKCSAEVELGDLDYGETL